MEVGADFLECLGPDTSTSVLTLLEDPADLVRASAVSRSWRRFVIANGFCKRLCLKICAEASHFACVIEGKSPTETEVGSSVSMEWQVLEREHRAYSYLTRCLTSPVRNVECAAAAISASSTDNYPDEGVENTLIESDRVNGRPSYWSSQGERDPSVPEKLIYRLGSKLCIINEIKVQPFEAYFQYGKPIYSSKAVRFRMGRVVSQKATGEATTDGTDEKFVWTYVSPEFPMMQRNELQSFKLPRPVICIGGIVQLEMLGRLQIQEMDQLYYICVRHVQVLGRPLLPVFDVGTRAGPGDSITLKYYAEKQSNSSEAPDMESSSWQALRERIRGWNHPILNTLLGVVESDSEDDDLFV